MSKPLGDDAADNQHLHTGIGGLAGSAVGPEILEDYLEKDEKIAKLEAAFSQIRRESGIEDSVDELAQRSVVWSVEEEAEEVRDSMHTEAGFEGLKVAVEQARYQPQENPAETSHRAYTENMEVRARREAREAEEAAKRDE